MYRTLLSLYFFAVPVFLALGSVLAFMGFGAALFVRPTSVATMVRVCVGLGGVSLLCIGRNAFRAGKEFLDAHDYMYVAGAAVITAVVLPLYLIVRNPGLNSRGFVLTAVPLIIWATYLFFAGQTKRRGKKRGTA